MADDNKKTEPVKPLTPDILRKMAASGKSLPSVEQAQLLEETDDAQMNRETLSRLSPLSLAASVLYQSTQDSLEEKRSRSHSKPNESQRGRKSE